MRSKSTHMCAMVGGAISRTLLIAGFALAATLARATALPDAATLLQSSDQARGGGLSGLLWEVDIVNRHGGEQKSTMKMRIKASDDASLAETLEPIRSKGNKMLQVGRNMWLTKPGLKKPLPISPRQRLTGQAAIGDIAATNYVRDYNAKVLREDSFDGQPCYVLELQARSKQATYDHLYYWVSKSSALAVHAEFLAVSGKRLKSADFEYRNSIEINGTSVPFVSRMTIRDELTNASTTLDYGGVKAQHIPASEFSVANFE